MNELRAQRNWEDFCDTEWGKYAKSIHIKQLPARVNLVNLEYVSNPDYSTTMKPIWANTICKDNYLFFLDSLATRL